MKRERRSYDKEFKLMAVELCHTGKSIKEVSEELGIRRELISRSADIFAAINDAPIAHHGNALLAKK